MSDRFRAVSKLARDDPPDRGARASDTWSCARCARRNSPAMRACETCGLDRVPALGTRRRANMAWTVPAPATGGGAPGDPAGWTGPSPRDPSTWRGPPNVSRAAFDRAAAAKYAAPPPPRPRGSRGGSPSPAGHPPDPPAGNRASSPNASPTEPAWRVADDPVLTETDGGDAHANQGVPREDAMMDEDGDEAGDFLYAEDAPRRVGAPEPPVVVDLTGPDADTQTLTLDTVALDGTPHDVRACVTCGLDLEEQPDVPLPPDPDDERPKDVVGRWLGRCERGCAAALCGPCLTARATTVLQRATRRLEVIISGLGTGYTMMDEDDAPDAPDARTPVVPCPCAASGDGDGDGDGRRRRGRECGAALRGAPLTEAEDETHKSWASAATEALFAAAAARAFAPKDPGADPSGVASGVAPGAAEAGPEPADSPAPEPGDAPVPTGDGSDPDPDPATVPVPVPTDARLARCPNRDCGAPVELLPPSPLPPGGLVAERDPNTGRWLSREALEHRHTRRYRCGVCAADFCGDCMVTPYHVGYHLCAAAAAAAAEPRCRYCDRSFLDLGQHFYRASGARRRGVSGEMSVREMRREMGDVDTTWCTEKEDLRSVYRLTSSVCLGAGCRVKLESACTRTLACGHPCGGIRGETECLPCLRCVPEPPPTDESTNAALAGLAGAATATRPKRKLAPRRLPRHDEDCCVCACAPLSAEPALLLGCGHVVHRRCAIERIRAGWPTQNITFTHLQCPLCGESGRPEGERGSAQAAVMLHPALAETLAPALSLREKIMRRARRRLVLDAMGPPYQLKPGGEYEGRPGEFALTRYNYYLCEQCEEPYFGGDRACHRGGVERGEGDGRASLAEHKFMCGSCSVTVSGKACKKGHGDDEMEYKCRYCCDVAVWFCFGTTHFCDKCHTAWIRDQPDWEDFPPKKTCTRKTCPLRVDHPDHGKEFCLGCAICRSAKSFYDKE